uniref:PD-(D/E)XK nuclease superfamily protein n=1 Tax=viral metagenome TaxID=1070528 RepID=A0A6M3J003_9ZZZZ
MKTIFNKEFDRIDFLDDRFYTDGDIYCPSVTHILSDYPKGYQFKQFLMDAGNDAVVKAERAAEKGSLIHDTIDRIIKGETIKWDDKIYTLDVWQALCKFLEFWTIYKPEVLASEFQLIDRNRKLGGTGDLLCVINGQIWLIDYKFTNGIYDTHSIQTSVYTRTSRECYQQKVDRFGVLWLKAKTKTLKPEEFQGKGWKLIEFTDTYEEKIKLFDAIHQIWLDINPNAKPWNTVYPATLNLTTEIKNA